jgi:integrase
MKSTSKKRTPSIVNLTVKRRYLTEREIERLMDCARKHGRYGHRDATMILVAYRHGLRACEVCDLQWQQIELSEGRLHVHRVKNAIPSVHPIRGDEMRALRKLRRDYPREAYVFVSERGGPISPIGFHRLIQRVGETATMPFPIHPHMLRHACGFKLANDGHDTRPRSNTSETRYSTPSGTPTWRPTGSRTFGGTDDRGAGSIAPHGRRATS